MSLRVRIKALERREGFGSCSVIRILTIDEQEPQLIVSGDRSWERLEDEPSAAFEQRIMANLKGLSGPIVISCISDEGYSDPAVTWHD